MAWGPATGGATLRIEPLFWCSIGVKLRQKNARKLVGKLLGQVNRQVDSGQLTSRTQTHRLV